MDTMYYKKLYTRNVRILKIGSKWLTANIVGYFLTVSYICSPVHVCNFPQCWVSFSNCGTHAWFSFIRPYVSLLTGTRRHYIQKLGGGALLRTSGTLYAVLVGNLLHVDVKRLDLTSNSPALFIVLRNIEFSLAELCDY